MYRTKYCPQRFGGFWDLCYFCKKIGDMEEKARWIQRFNNYHKALNRLASVINENERRELNEYERDSVVKRFEFTFECAWRVMKSYAEAQGEEEVGASRDSIRRAFQLHLIEDGESWMEMIKWRNETAHNYNGEVADSAIEIVKNKFFPLMIEFDQKMKMLWDSSHQDLFNQ